MRTPNSSQGIPNKYSKVAPHIKCYLCGGNHYKSNCPEQKDNIKQIGSNQRRKHKKIIF